MWHHLIISKYTLHSRFMLSHLISFPTFFSLSLPFPSFPATHTRANIISLMKKEEKLRVNVFYSFPLLFVRYASKIKCFFMMDSFCYGKRKARNTKYVIYYNDDVFGANNGIIRGNMITKHARALCEQTVDFSFPFFLVFSFFLFSYYGNSE